MKNQIKAGALLGYVDLIVKTASQLLYLPFLVRMLGQAQYGIYTVALGVASYLTLLNLGINSSYIRFYTKVQAESGEQGVRKLNGTYLLIFSLLGALALLVGTLLSTMLSTIFPKFTPEQIGDIRIMLLLLTVNTATSFPFGLFHSYIVAQERYIASKLIGLASALLSPILSIVALLCGGGAIWVVSATVITNLIAHGMWVIYAVARLKFRCSFSGNQRAVMRAITSFSYLIFIQIIAEQVNWNIDKILLGRYRSPEEVAVYGTGAQIQSLYMSIALAISNLFTPRIHKLVTDNQKQTVNDLFVKVGRIQFLLLGLVMSGFILFGRPFIGFWLGSEYATSYVIALLLMIPATVDLMQNTGIEIQRAMGLQKDRAILYLIVAVFNLLISIPMCIRYGGVGCAIGTAISFFICNILYMNIYYHRKMKLDIPRFWKTISKDALVICAVAVIGAMILRYIVIDTIFVLGLCILIYSIVYAAALILTKRLTKEVLR